MKFTKNISAITLALLLVLGLMPPTTALAEGEIAITNPALISKNASGDPAQSGVSQHAMSRDGRYVAYTSKSPDILPGQSPENSWQTYLYDRQLGTTSLISRDANGPLGGVLASSQQNYAGRLSISDNGRFVTFTGFTLGNPTMPYIYDRQTNTAVTLNPQGTEGNGTMGPGALSGDGNTVLYRFQKTLPGPADSTPKYYVFNRAGNERVGLPANAMWPSMSHDGVYVSYMVQESASPDTYSYHRLNIETNATELIDFGHHEYSNFGMNNDGSLIAYYANVTIDSEGQPFGNLTIKNLVTDQVVKQLSETAHVRGGPPSLMNFSADNTTLLYLYTDFIAGTNSVRLVHLSSEQSIDLSGGLARTRLDGSLSADGNYVSYNKEGNPNGATAQVYVAKLQFDVTPTVPANLTAPTPTNAPALTWQAPTGAHHYDIYRDGVKIGSSTTPSYTDATASQGTHSYTVEAIGASGQASGQSNPFVIDVDKTLPILTNPTLNPIFYLFGGTGTYTAAATDANGIVAAEVYVDIDPGQGNGQAATVNSGSISGNLVTDSLPTGLHRLCIRAKDGAGNWSASSQVVFIKI